MIQTKDLTKRFGSFTAVDHINLELHPGEIYGLLGPNGAGKTTTLSMILGVLEPTEGEVRLFGKRLSEDTFETRRRLGVMPEKQSIYPEMTAWEYLMFFADLFAVKGAEQRAQGLLERLNLWEWRDSLTGAYSTGMLKKLGLVRALLHSPDVLVLDEPAANLDPYGMVQIREVLAAERDAGRTILVSSHILSEVERTADRVGIIAGGKLLVEETIANMRRRLMGQHRIEVELVEPANGLITTLRGLPWVEAVQENHQVVTVSTPDDRDYRADLGRVLAGHGAIIQGMRTIETSLEEAFITLTEAHVQAWAGQNHDRE
jgi:ABC-2 type transport system ATP-binding protein